MPRLRFSVVIPTLNEERVLGRCLDALARLDFPQDGFEVIVVDNGSTDRTVGIAIRHSRTLEIRILDKKGVPVSALRNLGAEAARGEYLAFLDADCLPGPEWLSRAAAILDKAAGGAAGGFYALPPQSSWVARHWYGDELARQRGDVSYLPSGNLIISRDEFFAAGGFDESLATNEDYEFCQRLLGRGSAIRSYPELAVVHLGTPQTLRDFYRKQRWHGTHVFRVFLRDLPRLRNANAVALAFYTLACMAGLAIGLAAAIFGYPAPLIAAAAATVAAPAVLATWKALVHRSAGAWLAFAILFPVFGVARALCLLHWRPRAEVKRAVQERLEVESAGGGK